MNNRAIVILGKSGSGKGTQAELIAEQVRSQGGDIHHLEMGQAFRDFLRESHHTAGKSRDIARVGGLQPDFLANHFLTQALIKYANGHRSFIFDGTPRTRPQARVLDGALRFYGVNRPLVIHLEVADQVVLTRMQERGRRDDEQEMMSRRLSWFKEETLPVVEFFAHKEDYYQVLTLNGEQSIQEIAESITPYLTEFYEPSV